jgi:predicted O-linked N-acetylglucosamine transferase (SPINDLY family)
MNQIIKQALQYQHAGQLQQAEQLYRKALSENPQNSEALHLLGTLALQAGKPAIAHQLIDQATKITSNIAEYWLNLGLAQSRLNQFEPAIQSIDRALQLKPKFADALYHKANVLLQYGRSEDAIQSLRQALKQRSKFPEAHYKLGTILLQQGDINQAETCYRKSLQQNPKQANLLVDLGNLLSARQQLADAVACYQRALKLQPGHFAALDNLIGTQLKLCDWKSLDTIRTRLLNPVLQKTAPAAIRPFLVAQLPLEISSAERQQLARTMTRLRTTPLANLRTQLGFEHRPTTRAQLRIGYLSADFNSHATSHLIQGLFSRHDREQFEVFAYSIGKNDHSDFRQRIEADVDQFRELRPLNTVQAAQRIYQDGIDILVDLNGHAGLNRIEILALQAAPIQVTYLGHPGTLGADFIDYILTDAVVTPAEEQAYYDEQFVTLPHSYQVNDGDRPIAEETPTRADCNLPAFGTIFCSFCGHQKIEPQMFAVWMRILQRVPDSVLWLLEGPTETLANLRREAAAHGVAGERLIAAPKLKPAQHLARHRLADLFLDTYFYNGHTTTSDALWAGLPVLTCPGQSFPSRVSASLLQAVGLSELIMPDLSAYEETAVRLANQPAERQALHDKLSQQRLSTPLFDTARFARNLEQAYQQMWALYQAGEKPRAIVIEEKN